MEDDPVERGLAEAFGEERGGPAATVLKILQERTDALLGIHLDAPEPDDTLVKVTEQVRELRDPSGRYQVLGEIGRGGVGVVYKGRDLDLGRDVAMRVLRDKYTERPDILARFVEEAQIGGQLQHPGIVPVYELGLQSGERPYFAMKLVKGETLAAHLARRADPAQDRRKLLGLFEQVCQTVAYAHARRVVHRDLKPSNVMIGAFGEVQVVDWGFAKVLAKGGVADEIVSRERATERSVVETLRSTSSTGSDSLPGSMMGTPAYMPPEQALGDVERLDRRSDVFGLGAILCEILTGEPPYREADGDLVRQAARAELDPALGRLRASGADDSLIALTIECLSPAKRARPESAAEIVERIGAYLTSVEERARLAEVRATEARYRHRITLLAAAAGLTLILLGSAAWIGLQHQEQQRAEIATRRLASALNEASVAHGKAQAAGLDATLWDTAVTLAHQSDELARAEGVDEEMRGEAELLVTAVEQEREAARIESARLDRDRDMLARLEDLRLPLEDEENLRDHGWEQKEAERLDAAYENAFGEYLEGSVIGGPIEDVLAGLELGDIEVELATSLDHWSLARQERGTADTEETARIREIAARLDPDDGWRQRLRELLPDAAEQGEALMALASEVDYRALGPAGSRVLADALWLAHARLEACDVLSWSRDLFPQNFDLAFRLGFRLELLPEPNWHGASHAYEAARALRPDHTQVLHRLGQSLHECDSIPRAEQIFRILANSHPDAHWLDHLGEFSEVHKKDDEQALDLYEESVELEPDYVKGHLRIAAVAKRLGLEEKFRTSAREAMRLLRESREHPHSLAHEWEKLGKLSESAEDAAECFREAAELWPEQSHLQANLARAKMGLGRYEEAVPLFLLALSLDPEESFAEHHLGEALVRLGRFEEAAQRLGRALELDPEAWWDCPDLGCALNRLGDHERAIEHLRSVLRLSPDDGIARVELARAAVETRPVSEAIEFFADCMGRGTPAAGDVCDVAYVLAELGRIEDALDVIGGARIEFPENGAVHSLAGDLLRNAGEFEAARKAYECAVELFPEGDSQAHAREALERLPVLAEFREVLERHRLASGPEELQHAVREGHRIGALTDVVELVRDTERTNPELIVNEPVDHHWGAYDAACAAVRLGTDRNSPLAAEERAEMRELASRWLGPLFSDWIEWLESGEAPDEAKRRLDHALNVDLDLAGVRTARIDELPESERESWLALWRRVAGALAD